MRSKQQSPPAWVAHWQWTCFVALGLHWLERLFFCFLALLLVSKLTFAELNIGDHFKTCAGDARIRSSQV